jgi:hypothetical protein
MTWALLTLFINTKRRPYKVKVADGESLMASAKRFGYGVLFDVGKGPPAMDKRASAFTGIPK